MELIQRVLWVRIAKGKTFEKEPVWGRVSKNWIKKGCANCPVKTSFLPWEEEEIRGGCKMRKLRVGTGREEESCN